MFIEDYNTDIWDTLPLNSKDSYKALELILKVNKIKVYFWQDDKQIKHLMLESPIGEFDVPQLTGLDHNFITKNINSTGYKTYLDLVCTHPNFIAHFTLLTKLILEKIDCQVSEISNVVVNEIELWRIFIEKPNLGLLNKEEQLGLIAELLTLDFIAKSDPQKSLDYWKADEGGVDFISNSNLVVVKANSSGLHTHIINGIDQLKLIPNKRLFVFSFSFIESNNVNDINLADTFNKVRIYFEKEPKLYKDFYNKLTKKKFSYINIDNYKELKFELIDIKLYPINTDTPKLTSSELKQSLSPRINKVRYTLDFEGLLDIEVNDLTIKGIFQL